MLKIIVKSAKQSHFLHHQAARRSLSIMTTSTTARIIDGKALSQTILAELESESCSVRATKPWFNPTLALVQVGKRQDSSLYVKQKKLIGEKVIFRHFSLRCSSISLLFIVNSRKISAWHNC